MHSQFAMNRTHTRARNIFDSIKHKNIHLPESKGCDRVTFFLLAHVNVDLLFFKQKLQSQCKFHSSLTADNKEINYKKSCITISNCFEFAHLMSIQICWLKIYGILFSRIPKSPVDFNNQIRMNLVILTNFMLFCIFFSLKIFQNLTAPG